MYSLKKLLAFIALSLLVSCTNGVAKISENNNTDSTKQSLTETLYENEYGSIRLIEQNDSLMRTIFSNNEGDIFDTLLKIDYTFNLLPQDDYPFLRLNWGGIKVHHNRVQIWEFSNLTYLAQFISIEKMYERPFFKTNTEVTVSDIVRTSKGGDQISGIYFFPNTKYENEFVNLTGTIYKEKYPRSFYSTADSPQGMFSDTTKNYYRLMIQNPKIELIKKTIYKGYPVNTSENKAAIAWEFADSEAYTLEGHAIWSAEELQKPISVEGILIQDMNGSVLKNWKIIKE